MPLEKQNQARKTPGSTGCGNEKFAKTKSFVYQIWRVIVYFRFIRFRRLVGATLRLGFDQMPNRTFHFITIHFPSGKL